MKRLASPLLACLIGVSACDQPAALLAPAELDAPRFAASTTTTHFETPFSATALCGAPIGDIHFSGLIRGVDHTTVDGRGETHRTRVFRVQGLTAVNLLTGSTYDVRGGAEMLTWNTRLGHQPGNARFSVHSGTLVFEPHDGSPRITAQHRIRYFEDADGEVRMDFHAWRCVTQGTRNW